MFGTIPAYVNRTVVQKLFVLLYTLWPLPPSAILVRFDGGFFLFSKYQLLLSRRSAMMIDTVPEVLIIGILIFMALAVLES
jgi:hypothetical protein